MVWDGLDAPPQPPWKTVTEPELRTFLLERAREGFSFPINPVWPVRDRGWFEVMRALQQQAEPAANLNAWFPAESGVVPRIEQLHAAHPAGFSVEEQDGQSPHPSSRLTMLSGLQDCDECDLANFAALEVRREVQKRWRRIRGSVRASHRASMLAKGPPERIEEEAVEAEF